MTLSELREALARAKVTLDGSGATLLSEPELEAVAAELGLDEDDELTLDAQWALFAPVSADFASAAPPEDELVSMFVQVVVGPFGAEEEFFDQDEWIEMFDGADFPDGFQALLESASSCHTLMDGDPPRHLMLWSDETGWALIYPDRIVLLATPVALTEHLAQEAGG